MSSTQPATCRAAAPLAGNNHVLDHLAALHLAHHVHDNLGTGRPDPDQAARCALELAAATGGRPPAVRAQDALGLWVAEHHHGDPRLHAQAQQALNTLTAP